MVAVVREEVVVLVTIHQDANIVISDRGRWWSRVRQRDVVSVRGVFHHYSGSVTACGSAPDTWVLVRRSLAEKVARPCAHCYRESP